MRRGNRKEIHMSSLIQLKKAAPVFVVALVCFGVLPTMLAVSPPPDGGYPGGNTAEGQTALLSLTTGGFNTAVGLFSLRSDTTGQLNTAIGAGTLLANTADQNTATGAGALLSNTTGTQNTANGAFALFSNSGSFNTANGFGTLMNNTTGGLNTALGTQAGINVTTANNVICIGAQGANVSTSCFIANIRGVTTAIADAIPVLIDSAGQLGTISSSRRFKKEIEPMDKASEALLSLKPVRFHYKSDQTNTPQFGLIAEEVAEVNPDLVVHDKNGEIYTVRYDAVNAMLLNEFLKEHKAFLEEQRKVQEQQVTISQLKSTMAKQDATIAQQQKGMQLVTARLNEQEAQIQKVSAQLEASKPVPQVVNNP
jgi:uncharacterized coiled-coil protein SlyX